jgi:ABC transporter substrate binding protein (PQQ-dependent alcohol dehydrogenase system)
MITETLVQVRSLMRHALIGLLLVVPLWCQAAGAAERKPFGFLYVGIEGDPAYQPHRAYTGLVLKDLHRPVDGAETALRESRIIGRSVGLKFGMETLYLDAGSDIVGQVASSAADTGAGVILLDLPLEPFRRIVDALGKRGDLVLFNIRHPDNSLRGSGCAPALFHTLPSTSMLTDAAGQYLKSRGWNRLLVLVGEGEGDLEFADAFTQSARKFGLRIVGRLGFVLSNDPREREKNNIRLLTGGPQYDLIFLSDSEGEFGRYVPFASHLARPVVGTEGLIASAWHWTWERHGAPQLNQRFDRLAKRRMQVQDWAAWAAIRSVVEAIVRSGKTDIASIRATLTSSDFTFDTYKGVSANYRSWNNQLRQPILLHTHNAVIARAPVDGFLHKDNVLDSLGTDARENDCQLQ